ncbi:hypothetical protein DL546_001042 [Coniochaeta pulveracea]|uniref:Uncharacterized protein n=1 Tax=Coniochaeta pulveracea TaxID=177199 RepID=A0A420Y5K1_9PEZI|nr:hypothetical protein DL546_001042 [Coniochaeta pulveracea]
MFLRAVAATIFAALPVYRDDTPPGDGTPGVYCVKFDTNAYNGGQCIATWEAEVLHPAAGDVVKAGSTFLIVLNETFHSVDRILLARVINTTTYHLLEIGNVTGVDNAFQVGGYPWNVPSQLPSGDNYVLMPFGMSDYYSRSSVFTISNTTDDTDAGGISSSMITASMRPGTSTTFPWKTQSSAFARTSSIGPFSPSATPVGSSASSRVLRIGWTVVGTLCLIALILCATLWFALRRRRLRNVSNLPVIRSGAAREKYELDGESSPRTELYSPSSSWNYRVPSLPVLVGT